MEPYHCDRMDDALNLLNTTFYELSITYFKIRYTVSLDYIMTLKSSSRSRLSPSRDIEEALNHVGINRIMRQNVALMFKMLSNIIQIFVDNFSFLLQSLGYIKLHKCFKNFKNLNSSKKSVAEIKWSEIVYLKNLDTKFKLGICSCKNVPHCLGQNKSRKIKTTSTFCWEVTPCLLPVRGFYVTYRLLDVRET